MNRLIASALFLASLSVTASAQEGAPAPPDAKPLGLRVNDAGAFSGYTMFAPIRSGHIFLIDMHGEIVHDWHHGLPPMSNYFLDNGHVVFLSRIDDNPVFFGGGIGGRIQELDWDGKVVWEYVLSNEQRMLHHDIEPMPNGNWLAIAWEYLSPAQAAALGRNAEAIDEHGFWPDAVLEIEPVRPNGGRIVWEWRAQDHLIQDVDPAKPNCGSIAEHPERFDINVDCRDARPMTDEERQAKEEREEKLRALGYVGGRAKNDGEKKDGAPPQPGHGSDWLHTNSVSYDAAHDLILLSSPHLDELFVIDHSTTTEEARGSRGGRYGKGGDLLYRWGNPGNYGAGSKADRQLFGQHQVEWIKAGFPGAGHLLLFNNNRETPGEGKGKGKAYSSVDELVLPFDAARGFARETKKAFGPSAASWSYTAPTPQDFYSFFISGCQRLPNGNTFICEGQSGRLFEVTADRRIVWEYLNPFGGEIPASFGGANPNKDPKAPNPVLPVSVFRATRIPPDHPGLKGRTLRAKQ